MKILYISASLLPSQYANSIHVMKMCGSLSKNNQVTLIGIEGEEKDKNIYEYYNVKNNFTTILTKSGKFSLFQKIRKILEHALYSDIIYSRYTLGAFICAFLLNKPVIYEYHTLMDSPINILFEKLLAKKKKIRHIFITSALMERYMQRNPSLLKKDCFVLADSADDPKIPIQPIYNKKLNCGYIGSFQKGKGIEQVIEIAALCPEVCFHILGGTEKEIKQLKQSCKSNNIIWYGFVKPKEAMNILNEEIDIALLPNQKNMFIGKKAKNDIGGYTSPMKLFEYMSFGKAIIASKLSVLEEILIDKYNALLVDCENVTEWVSAIQELSKQPDLFNQLRCNAYKDFVKYYTWDTRAESAINGLEVDK